MDEALAGIRSDQITPDHGECWVLVLLLRGRPIIEPSYLTIR
jgi:hypothetical protein